MTIQHMLTTDRNHVKMSVDNIDTASDDVSFLLSISACIYMCHKPKTLKKRRTSEFFFKFNGKQLHQVLKLQRTINFVADPRNQKTVLNIETLDKLEVVKIPQGKFLVLVNTVNRSGRRARERKRW